MASGNSVPSHLSRVGIDKPVLLLEPLIGCRSFSAAGFAFILASKVISDSEIVWTVSANQMAPPTPPKVPSWFGRQQDTGAKKKSPWALPFFCAHIFRRGRRFELQRDKETVLFQAVLHVRLVPTTALSEDMPSKVGTARRSNTHNPCSR